jgi:anti-sigma factor RsiW
VSCKEFDTLIQGYLDGELDLLSTLRIEAHCASCARTYESQGTAVRHEQRQDLFQASK